MQFLQALELTYTPSLEQIQNILVMVNPLEREVLVIRSRGGSKTFDAMIVCIYYAYLGFHVIFWCSSKSQMEQPCDYLSDLTSNNFLQYCIADQTKLKIEFDNRGWIKIRNLTKKQVRSQRCDLECFDEEAQADKDVYNASSPVLSVSKIKRKIHLSTPVLGSVFEENYKRLIEDHKPVLSLRWDQCAHMNQDVEFMRTELKTKSRWWIRQEYFCSFEAAHGAVFENVIHGPFDLTGLCNNYNRTHIHYGVDWNPVAGHFIVGTRWSDDYSKLYVIMEKNLGTNINTVLNSIFELLRKDEHSLCEIEDGGTNCGYCDSLFSLAYQLVVEDEKLRNILTRIQRRSWDSAGKNKGQSINNVQPCVIYVDPQITPGVSYWLSASTWDENYKGNDQKLKKDSEQHPLDSFLHSSWIGDRGVSHN